MIDAGVEDAVIRGLGVAGEVKEGADVKDIATAIGRGRGAVSIGHFNVFSTFREKIIEKIGGDTSVREWR